MAYQIRKRDRAPAGDTSQSSPREDTFASYLQKADPLTLKHGDVWWANGATECVLGAHRRLVCVFTPFTFHQPGKWERFLTSFTPVTWKIWNNVISGVAQQMSIVPFFQFQVSTFENGDRKSHWLNAMGWVTHNMAPYCNLVPPWYITMEYLRKQRLFFFPPMKKKIQFSRICAAAHDVFPVGKILRRTSWWHHLEEKIGIFNIS